MKDRHSSTRDAWKRIWQEEADLPRELETLSYKRSRQQRALYLPLLPKEEMILEAGCGLGREVICLDSEGYRVVGIDFAENALHRLNSYHRGYRLAAADVHKLPFQDGVFGAYLSFGVLEHFEFGPEPGLREANRVLRQDGVLVLLMPYPNLIWRLIRFRKRLFGKGLQKQDLYESTYTVRQLEQSLRHAGFEILEKHPVGHSFTLWGLGGPFQAKGYYRTSSLSEFFGAVCRRLLPWAMCFESLLVAQKSVFRSLR